jgi:hypothetical protein
VIRKIECGGTAETYSRHVTDAEDAVKHLVPTIEAKPELQRPQKYRGASGKKMHRQPIPTRKVNTETPWIRAKIIEDKAVDEPQGNDCRREHENSNTFSHDRLLLARSRPIARTGYLLVWRNLTRSGKAADRLSYQLRGKNLLSVVMTSCGGTEEVAGYPDRIPL